MLGMKRLIESNAATAAAASTTTEANPVLRSTANLAHQLASDLVGQGRDTLENTSSPHLGYNRSSYPYGLPPNFTPPAMHENTDHAIPFTFEGQPPQPVGGAHEEPWEHAQGDISSYPFSPLWDRHPMPYLNLISWESLNPARFNHYSSP